MRLTFHPARQVDIVAGLSVGAMVVPQGLSYAKLAGLPQVWGLYGAFVPCLIYFGFGSSRQLVNLFFLFRSSPSSCFFRIASHLSALSTSWHWAVSGLSCVHSGAACTIPVDWVALNHLSGCGS